MVRTLHWTSASKGAVVCQNQRSPMDQHRRDLARQLFTLATFILEDTHIPISEGQSARLVSQQYRRRAQALSRAADDLAAVAGAIKVALTSRPPPRLQQSRGESPKAKSKAIR